MWIEAKQVAAMLGCSPRTIWRMRRLGLIPNPVRISRKMVRWPKAAIEQWMESRHAEAAALASPPAA